MNIEDANKKVQEWINDGDFDETLDLDDLTSAEGLTLPTSIGGGLSLNGLRSAEGLTLPTSIKGRILLNGLTIADKNVLRNLYPNLAKRIS